LKTLFRGHTVTHLPTKERGRTLPLCDNNAVITPELLDGIIEACGRERWTIRLGGESSTDEGEQALFERCHKQTLLSSRDYRRTGFQPNMGGCACL
jgi:hypothetical protein